MQNKKTLSILIPTGCYREEFLKQTLLSIFCQNLKINYEIIINFNCGKINFVSLSNLDLNLKVFSEKFTNNWGESYYFLFKKAQGKYIYFLEDDDILLTDFLF